MNTHEPGGGFLDGPGGSRHDADPEEGGGGGVAWTDAVDGVVDAERVRMAAEERRRDRWRRERAAERTTVVTALRAAAGEEASLHLCTGDVLHGTVVVVGSDVVGLASASQLHWVALRAVTVVGVAALSPVQPVPVAEPTMAEVVEQLRATAARVRVRAVGTTTLHGEIVAAGAALTLWDPDLERYAVVDLDAVVTIT